jgi:alpha-1,2-mannosyltransferase
MPDLPSIAASSHSSHFSRQAGLWLAIILLSTFAISLLGRHYSPYLEGISPIDLTNLSAIRSMVHGLLNSSGQGDSWVPMRQALTILHNDQSQRLYETLFFARTVRFQYPLTSLVPLEFLSLFGLESVRALNLLNFAIYCLNAAAAGTLAWLLFSKPSAVPGQVNRAVAIVPAAVIAVLAIVATLTFYPVLRAMVLGQIQVWIDALLTLAVIFWLVDRRLLAGICVGFACTIKPQFALLLIWGLLSRQKAFSAGIIAVSVPISFLSLLLYGLHNNITYLDVLAFLSKHGESFFANNSVNGILNGYFSPNDSHIWDASGLTPFVPIVYAGTLVASVVAVGAILIPPLLDRNVMPSPVSLGVAATCTVIGSPVAWEHHYGILLPFYLVGLRDAFSLPSSNGRTIIFIILSLSWICVANIIPFVLLAGNTPFSFLQAHCFFGALLLLGALFALKKYANRLGVLEPPPPSESLATKKIHFFIEWIMSKLPCFAFGR